MLQTEFNISILIAAGIVFYIAPTQTTIPVAQIR